MPLTKPYAVCSIERTGSYLLCDGLTLTGIAGQPREYFHPHHLARIFAEPSLSGFRAYMARIVAEGTTPNGVFGFKIHWSHFENLLCRLHRFVEFKPKSGPEVLQTLFPNLRYIRLTRRDKVKQAISFSKARQTDVWWQMRMWVRANRRAPAAAPAYNFDALEQIIRQIELHEKNWARFLHDAGVTPLDVVYEDLVSNYDDTIRRTLEYLDVPVPDHIPPLKPRY
ncbi:MAG: sulfotransferase, partial [Acidobacteriaceae bacterium]|nr:sulfotransferase [Acidobacteriaceae bacterium]